MTIKYSLEALILTEHLMESVECSIMEMRVTEASMDDQPATGAAGKLRPRI